MVHVNTTAEDVLNQTGWPALWIAAGSGCLGVKEEMFLCTGYGQTWDGD